MRTARDALVSLFRRHPNQWLAHDVVYEAGRHNSTARLSELRQEGFVIAQRGRGELSEYCMTHDPFKQTYATVSCPACLWTGSELDARGGGSKCPKCDTATVSGELRQMVML